MTVLDALLDARMSEAYAEALHPRGRGGKWIPKVGERASYFHSMLGRSLDVRVHTSPDRRGYMKIRMPAHDPFNGEVRRVHASSVSSPSGVPVALMSARQADVERIRQLSPGADREAAAYRSTLRASRK